MIEQQTELPIALPVKPTPPRPTRRESAVLDLAAEKLCDRLMKDWVSKEDAKHREEYLKDIRYVLDGAFDLDGFELAKDLERRGWSPNAMLVEELDQTDWIVREAHTVAECEWVKFWQVTTMLKVGDHVTFQDYRGLGKSETVQGEITKIHQAEARVTVFCQSLGHVCEGLGTHGHIVNYEDVALVESRPELEP